MKRENILYRIQTHERLMGGWGVALRPRKPEVYYGREPKMSTWEKEKNAQQVYTVSSLTDNNNKCHIKINTQCAIS